MHPSANTVNWSTEANVAEPSVEDADRLGLDISVLDNTEDFDDAGTSALEALVKSGESADLDDVLDCIVDAADDDDGDVEIQAQEEDTIDQSFVNGPVTWVSRGRFANV